MYYLRIDKDVGAICFKDTCLRAAGEESSRPRIPAPGNPRTAAPEQTGLRANTETHKSKRCNKHGCYYARNRKRMKF